jgi:hypothetical protein
MLMRSSSRRPLRLVDPLPKRIACRRLLINTRPTTVRKNPLIRRKKRSVVWSTHFDSITRPAVGRQRLDDSCLRVCMRGRTRVLLSAFADATRDLPPATCLHPHPSAIRWSGAATASNVLDIQGDSPGSCCSLRIFSELSPRPVFPLGVEGPRTVQRSPKFGLRRRLRSRGGSHSVRSCRRAANRADRQKDEPTISALVAGQPRTRGGDGLLKTAA